VYILGVGHLLVWQHLRTAGATFLAYAREALQPRAISTGAGWVPLHEVKELSGDTGPVWRGAEVVVQAHLVHCSDAGEALKA
jgi:hypothetical protein